eukprot:Sdes_comp20964_c0_seq1m18753
MRHVVLKVFTQLLVSIKQRWIPHIHAHQPLKELLRYFYATKSSQIDAELMEFLTTLAQKLNQDPSLARFFIDEPKPQVCGSSSPNHKHPPLKQNTPQKSSSSDPPQFILFNMLSELVWSDQVEVGNAACGALLQLVSTPFEEVARLISTHTLFCPILVQKLSSLFNSLPPILNQREVEEFSAYLRDDPTPFHFSSLPSSQPPHPPENDSFAPQRVETFASVFCNATPVCQASIPPAENHPLPPSQPTLNTLGTLIDAMHHFTEWVQYCDTIAAESNPIVGKELVKLMRLDFLTTTIAPLLSHAKEKRAYSTTVYLNHLLARLKSALLIDTLLDFLLGASSPHSPPEQQQDEIRPPLGFELRSLLIARAKQSTCFDLSLATLHLFDTIVKKHSEKAMWNLVLRNLVHAAPLLHHFHIEKQKLAQMGESIGSTQWTLPSPASPSSPPQTVSVTDAFLALIPYDSPPPSSSSPPSSPAFPAQKAENYAYLLDAQQQVLTCYWSCQHWRHPQLPPASSKLSRPDHTDYFYEGSFLSMLYNRLEHVLDQPHPLNLVVTSLFARLCEYPQPLLHYYFMNPSIPLHPHSFTLYRILSQVSFPFVLPDSRSNMHLHYFLEQVSQDLSLRARLTPNFHENIQKVRLSLDRAGPSPSLPL